MKKNFYIIIMITIVFLLSGCKNIKLKTIEIEAGTELPLDVNYYLDKKVSNPSKYILDISEVNTKLNGEYKYTIKKNSQILEGIIKVNDSKDPYVEVKDVYIEAGNNVNPNDFIAYFKDVTMDYNVSFSNYIPQTDLNKIGDLEMYIEISDVNGNKIGKKVMVHILPKGTLDQVRETDLEAYMHNSSERNLDIDILMDNYYIKFDKAIPVTDVKSVIGIERQQLKNYFKDKNFEVIGIYNKYDYLIAVTIRVLEQDNDKTIVSYLHPDDLK